MRYFIISVSGIHSNSYIVYSGSGISCLCSQQVLHCLFWLRYQLFVFTASLALFILAQVSVVCVHSKSCIVYLSQVSVVCVHSYNPHCLLCLRYPAVACGHSDSRIVYSASGILQLLVITATPALFTLPQVSCSCLWSQRLPHCLLWLNCKLLVVNIAFTCSAWPRQGLCLPVRGGLNTFTATSPETTGRCSRPAYILLLPTQTLLTEYQGNIKTLLLCYRKVVFETHVYKVTV